MKDDTRELPARDKSKERQSALYLLTGLILGLIFGLIYTRFIDPVVYNYHTPASLKENYKETYRTTIAQVYAATGDLARARERLMILEDEDPINALGAQAQRTLASGNPDEARALALLASALQSGNSPEGKQLPGESAVPTITMTEVTIPTHTLPATTPLP